MERLPDGELAAGRGIENSARALDDPDYAREYDQQLQGAAASFLAGGGRTGGVPGRGPAPGAEATAGELGESVVPNPGTTAAGSGTNKFSDTLKIIKNTGKAPAGFKGGSNFINDGRAGGQVLPKTDAAGNSVTYKKWDVNPYQKGVNRGAERIVTGSDGQFYYTTDHYKTFTPME